MLARSQDAQSLQGNLTCIGSLYCCAPDSNCVHAGMPTVIWQGKVFAAAAVVKRPQDVLMLECRLGVQRATWPPGLEQGWGQHLVSTFTHSTHSLACSLAHSLAHWPTGPLAHSFFHLLILLFMHFLTLKHMSHPWGQVCTVLS